jgi:hypothetical protein
VRRGCEEWLTTLPSLSHTQSLSLGWGMGMGGSTWLWRATCLLTRACRAPMRHLRPHHNPQPFRYPSQLLPTHYGVLPSIHTSTHPRIRLRPHNSAPGLDHGSGADLNLDPDLCPYAVSCQITCPFDPFSSSAHLQGCTVCTVCPAQRLWLASFSRLSVAHVLCPLPRFSKPHRLLSSSSCPSSVALDNLIVVWSVRVSYQD